MNIRTKFDIGQELFGICKDPAPCPHCGLMYTSDKWVVEGPFTIDGVMVDVASNGTIRVWYGALDECYQMDDQDCFLTEAEAQAECDRRNIRDIPHQR